MESWFINLLSVINLMLLALGSGFGIVSRRRLPKAAHPLLLYVVLVFGIQLGAYVLWLMDARNIFLLHVLTLVESVLIPATYINLLFDRKRHKRMAWLLMALLILFLVIQSLSVDALRYFNPMGRTVEGLVIIFMGSAFIARSLEMRGGRTPQLGWSIISSAIVIYFSGSLLIYLFSNYSLLNLDFSINISIWSINGILSMIYYSLMLLGLWKLRQQAIGYSG